MKITIAVQVHNFQRRFCWMLSSLAQQTARAHIVMSVAFVRGNGRPTTEQVLDLFNPRLKLCSQVWKSVERFQYRGLVRNLQLEQCDTDWLMFGDCDMVYHPEYFERLLKELDRNHSNATYMLSSGRVSNPKEEANKMVNREVLDVAREVPNAFALADALPKRPMRNVGAGFCQLIHMRLCPHGGYYVKPEENRDWSWDRRGSNPKSDMQFRKRISKAGGPRQNLPDWFSANAIHLNHNRDPEAGHHITEQR